MLICSMYVDCMIVCAINVIDWLILLWQWKITAESDTDITILFIKLFISFIGVLLLAVICLHAAQPWLLRARVPSNSWKAFTQQTKANKLCCCAQSDWSTLHTTIHLRFLNCQAHWKDTFKDNKIVLKRNYLQIPRRVIMAVDMT